MPAVSISALMNDPVLRRQCMTQAKAGDAAAFERILEAHAPLVLRTAQRLLLNEADAADAAQEVFVRLHKSLAKFDAGREFLPWLYRMTVNICHDLRRRRKISLEIADLPEPAASGATPEELMNLEERRSLLYEALAVLSDRERDAIVLRDLEGLTTAQTAAALGTAESTIRSQISMGRVKLRDYIAIKLRRRT
jgi:RNA polymerase sigma-70 factor (ECF subfamily)